VTIQFKEKTIGIGGAGFSGTSIFAGQIFDIQQEWAKRGCPNDFPSTRIKVADPSGSFGDGSPYKEYSPDDIALLNQPAYAMSPFPNRPNHFCDWLQGRFPEVSPRVLENSFQLRATYGEYLREVFKQAVQQARWANFPVKVEIINAAITDATYTGKDWCFDASGQQHQCDELIIADGHHQNEYLAEFRDHSLYFDGHLNREGYETIKGPNKRILIVGSGQTMMDRLSELEHYDYDGDVHVVSRRGVLPWLFEPQIYRADANLRPYQLKQFTAENVEKTADLDALQFLWEKEIAIANGAGYGPGHVMKAFYDDQTLQSLNHPKPEIWQLHKRVIEAWYGNPTSPQRFATYQKAIQQKRFHSHQSPISADKIEDLGDSFKVTFADREEEFDAIFNAAGCARGLISPSTGRIRSPLIAKLDEKGYIRWKDKNVGLIEAGEQLIPTASYAGPYSFNRWGCESYRVTHAGTAKRTLGLQQRLAIAA